MAKVAAKRERIVVAHSIIKPRLLVEPVVPSLAELERREVVDFQRFGFRFFLLSGLVLLDVRILLVALNVTSSISLTVGGSVFVNIGVILLILNFRFLRAFLDRGGSDGWSAAQRPEPSETPRLASPRLAR